MATTVKYSLTPDRINTILNAAEKKGPEAYEKVAWLEDHREEGIPFEGLYDFGGNLEGAVEKFGEDKVYGAHREATGLWLGGRVRNMLEAGKTEAEIQDILDDPTFKPGKVVKSAKKKGDAYTESLDKNMDNMTEEELDAEEARLAEMLDKINQRKSK